MVPAVLHYTHHLVLVVEAGALAEQAGHDGQVAPGRRPLQRSVPRLKRSQVVLQRFITTTIYLQSPGRLRRSRGPAAPPPCRGGRRWRPRGARSGPPAVWSVTLRPAWNCGVQ